MKTYLDRSSLGATVAGKASSLLVAGGLFLGGLVAAAADYSLTWSKIAGGGGTSRSAHYSLSGTLGQHDAGGPMRGGNFAMTGGFWSLAAVQSPGAPLLRMFAANGSVVVAWPAPSSGWTLEQCSNLATASWSAADGGTTSAVGSENQFTIASPSGNRFFRLTRTVTNSQ